MKYGISAEKGVPAKKKGIAQLADSISKLATGGWRQGDPSFPIRKRIIPVLLVHDPLIDAPLHPWFLAREFAGLLVSNRLRGMFEKDLEDLGVRVGLKPHDQNRMKPGPRNCAVLSPVGQV